MTRQEILSLRVRRAVIKDLGLAGVLLYVPLIVKEMAEAVAWTDGSRMYFGPKFFTYSEAEQLGICIHECLHVVFRHQQRGMAIWEKEGSAFQHEAWNAACDAVINHAIGKISWASLPDNVVRMGKLLPKDVLTKRPAHLWTSEQVYDELKRGADRTLVSSFSLANDLNGTPESKAWQRANSTGQSPEPEQRDPALDRHQREMDTRLWRERIVRAQAGSLPSGVLRKLASDVPQPQIRWELVLREFLKARCMPVTETSWNRPSRRSLSLGQEAGLIEPGYERKKGVTRIGAVVDTSGSITDEVIRTFVAEINGVMKLTAAEVVVIDCDAAVHGVRVFRQPLRDYRPLGGGGTDFRPGIAELQAQRVTVGVYLTDLQGTFPERRPSFPLLWAVTKDLQVPFGRKILIPKK